MNPNEGKSAEQLLDEADNEALLNEGRRAEMMHTIAVNRWKLARFHHKLENGEPLNFERWPFQIEIYQNDATDLVLYGSVGWGKRAARTCKIHTPSGWRRLGDIIVGDEVTAVDGTSVKVLGVYPQGVQPMYRVRFSDGRSTLAGDEHLWEVHHTDWRKKWKVGESAAGTMKPRVITTLQLAELIAKPQKRRVPYCVPLCAPVPKPHRDLLIDPYALGLLIGDGHLSEKGSVTIFKPDRFVTLELERGLHKTNPECAVVNNGREGSYRVNIGVRPNGGQSVKDRLRAVGLLGHNAPTKFIPKEYLEASLDQRWAMMNGLMDTDGTSSPSLSYSTASLQLAEDVCELVRSLGGIAVIGSKIPTYTYKGVKKIGLVSYKVNIRHPEPRRFFRLQRKLDALPKTYQYSESLKLAVQSIEREGEADSVCIYVDHPRHLYITDDYICTHNTPYLILDSMAKAMFGLRVIYVIDTRMKRNALVLSKVDPLVHTVQFYKAMMRSAVEELGSEMDSTFAKHFGEGMMIFIGSNAEGDFYTYRGDATIIDEHHLCDQNNLKKLFGRRTGSFYRFETVCGNASDVGTQENQNLDWLYRQSDQRKWHVPCPHCGVFQVLGWTSHFIDEERNELGAIISVRPKDREREGQEVLDIRPICTNCHKPMRRLTSVGRDADGEYVTEGKWVAMNPGKNKRGYHLSSLYNPDQKMNDLFAEYIKAMADPGAMKTFINDQLGNHYSVEGSSFTNEMMDRASTGSAAGISPYRFEHAHAINFREMPTDLSNNSQTFIDLPSGSMGLQINMTVSPCIMGVDIRPGGYDTIIGDILESTLHKLRVIRPVFCGKLRNEKEVIWVARQYAVRFGVADCRPAEDSLRRTVEHAERLGIELWRAEYMTRPSAITITRNEREKLMTLERTRTIDIVHHAFQTGLNVALPQNYRQINQGSFGSEMCASTRTPTNWHNRPYYDWVKNGEDHALHAMNLLFVAAEQSGLLRYGFGEGNYFEQGRVSSSYELAELKCCGVVLPITADKCPKCGKYLYADPVEIVKRRMQADPESNSLCFEA